jgi:hypothetical protein
VALKGQRHEPDIFLEALNIFISTVLSVYALMVKKLFAVLYKYNLFTFSIFSSSPPISCRENAEYLVAAFGIILQDHITGGFLNASKSSLCVSEDGYWKHSQI